MKTEVTGPAPVSRHFRVSPIRRLLLAHWYVAEEAVPHATDLGFSERKSLETVAAVGTSLPTWPNNGTSLDAYAANKKKMEKRIRLTKPPVPDQILQNPL